MHSGVHRYCKTGDTQGKCKDKYYSNEPISLSEQPNNYRHLIGREVVPAVKPSDLEINGNFPIDCNENRVASRAQQPNLTTFNSH